MLSDAGPPLKAKRISLSVISSIKEERLVLAPAAIVGTAAGADRACWRPPCVELDASATDRAPAGPSSVASETRIEGSPKPRRRRAPASWPASL